MAGTKVPLSSIVIVLSMLFMVGVGLIGVLLALLGKTVIGLVVIFAGIFLGLFGIFAGVIAGKVLKK